MNLNAHEMRDYELYIKRAIPNLPAGRYFFRDFFPNRSASPRIAAQLYSDVSQGKLLGVTLYGQKSADGYVIY